MFPTGDIAVTVLRGIVISAERAEEICDAIERAGGEDGFEDFVDISELLDFEAPLDKHDYFAGDGSTVVVVGVSLGDYEGGLLRIDDDGGFTPIDYQGGTAKTSVRGCPVSDDDIAAELTRCGLSCTGSDIGTFVVSWGGYS